MIRLIIKQILINLAKPHKIPIKIFGKIYYYFKFKKYNQSFFENEQNKIFNSLNLNRQQGIKNLNLIKNILDHFNTNINKVNTLEIVNFLEKKYQKS